MEQEADKVLSSTLFKHEQVLHSIWVNYPPHPIQEQEPNGDRKWIKAFPLLMVSYSVTWLYQLQMLGYLELNELWLAFPKIVNDMRKFRYVLGNCPS